MFNEWLIDAFATKSDILLKDITYAALLGLRDRAMYQADLTGALSSAASDYPQPL